MERIVEDFLELVRLGAASRDERKIADYMTKHLEELGFDVYEDDTAKKVGGNTGNLFAHLAGEGGRPLLLSAHMDRVDRGYDVRPVFEGEYICSDGTTILGADNVSGLAAILDGLRRVKEGGKRHSPIEVVLSVCEEKGILGARLMEKERLKAVMGYVFDSSAPFGVIETMRPYKAMMEIEVIGKSAHAGNAPERGVNAIVAAANMLAGIRDGRLDEETTSNIGVFHGGLEEPGTVCDKVSIRIEARSHNYEKLMAHLDYLEEYCRGNIAKTKASCRIGYELQHQNYAYTEQDPVVALVMSCLTEMGVTPVPQKVMGGCDGNIFAAHGIACVSVGLGNENSHSLQERVHVPSLIKAGELAERLILAYGKEERL